MDFLKACTTNVHAIENLSNIRYCRYEHTGQALTEINQWIRMQSALASLRQQNVLCACAHDNLWLFGDIDDAQDHVLELFNAIEEDNLQDWPNKQTSNGAFLRDILLDAVEGGLAFSLARNASTVHVAPWIWIYTDAAEGGERPHSYVMKLHTRFAPSGGLYLLPEVKPTEWCPVDLNVTPTQELLLAPSGCMVVPTPAEADNVIIDASWKTSVTRTLESEGIQLPSDAQWIAIQSTRSTTNNFIWPATLLLLRHSIADSNPFVDENIDWRCWFTRTGTEGIEMFRNPLAVAEEWFNSGADRQRAMQANNAANASASGDDSAMALANLANSTLEDADMISPPFTQRSLDQQSVMAGIYPTPPDGLAQGQQSLVSMPATTPSVRQGEQGTSAADQIQVSDDAQLKPQDFPTSLNVAGFQMEQDELFGDSGEMEFGENEVGDADFSFFDEPDDEHNENRPPDPESEEMQDDEQQMQLEVPEFPAGDDALTKEDVVAPLTSLHDATDYSSHPSIRENQTPNPETADASTSLVTPQFSGNLVPLEKPLSPFGIRERLLPPPVPASIAQSDAKDTAGPRRSSTFSPIVFRERLNLGPRYEVPDPAKEESQTRATNPTAPSISLPPIRKKSRLLRPNIERDARNSDSESEEDSYESSSSDDDETLPPKLPWDSRKRKRHIDLNAPAPDSSLDSPWPNEASHEQVTHYSNEHIFDVLKQQFEPSREGDRFAQLYETSVDTQDDALERSLRLDEFSNLRKEDVIYVAQIIGEQAVTAVDFAKQMILTTEALYTKYFYTGSSAWKRIISKVLENVFPNCELCDLGKISLTRDPHPQPRTLTNPGRPSQGQPRPPPIVRADSMTLGPDYFPLQPPYVKVQRGTDNWEMLSTSLSFWEPLGLAPANGPKDVRAFCMFPYNEDLQHLVEQFLAELGTAYEGCKLGSHTHLRNIDGNVELDNYEDGMAPVDLGSDPSLESALKAYASTCTDLGEALSFISHHEPNRTIVIYMLNPFQGHQARQYLCACFWLLFKAYRDNLPKVHRNQCGSDIVLQLLPIGLIADFDLLIAPDTKELATLAREVYDRCPPSSAMQAADNTSALSIFAAPSVELASAAPKRIGFQLAADPPSDLLHEGSILHIAYSCTSDRQWLAATWLDNTGQYYSTASFSLRGRSFADGADDLWERTREIIAARQVTWRIFLVTPDPVDRSISQCWRSISSIPRQQPLCVTMLSAQTDPGMQLSPLDTQAVWNNVQDQGFLTPASTPQASTFTSSPDVGNHANAPPTPAPSETAASWAENDPDAHLVDVTDESWGVMLSPKVTNLASCVGLANGALFKRGDANPPAGKALPSLGVSLHWTTQIKPNGSVDEGSVKQAELTLREVLRMYRNLSLLTKQRGLLDARLRVAPLHVAAAMRGADWLNGMLPVNTR